MRNLLFTLTLSAALTGFHAYADDIVYEGITYSVNEGAGTEVTAKGFAGETSENLVLPSTFNVEGTEYTVVAIADEAFRFAGLRTAQLPETLRVIGNSAFGFNMFMREINLPENLESVGDNAFQRCWSAIMTPKGIRHIGTGAFWECSKMTEVVLAADAEVGENAFMYCTGVKTLTLEGAPLSVGACALAFNSLEELIVNSATPPAFAPEDVFCYGDNETRDYEWTLNLSDVALKVPAGAAETYKTDRNWSVFTNVSELQPDVITDFTIAPFVYKVTADGEVAVTAFDGSATSCAIPASVEYSGQTFSVTSIAANSFANSALTDIAIPGSVRSIGENAFVNCASLTAVSFEEGTETIEKYAFSNTSLTSVTLPKGMTQVGYGAFMGCRSLAEVTLPEGINLDILVFFNCSLTNITLNGTPGSLGGDSMTSSLLREITFHTDVVPDLSPINIWLIYDGEFNDQVVLIVDSEEMAEKFKASAAWDVFKGILPEGASYDPEAPYLPQSEIVSLETLETSTGLKTFVPETDGIRMLTPFDLSFILWDGTRGVRIEDFSHQISGVQWWDNIKSGDYVNGYIIGFMNPETNLFTSTSHSVESIACPDEIIPLTVTGSELVESAGITYQYSYVTMNGTVRQDSFESEDGHTFSFKNLYNEDIFTVTPCELGAVRGIYMREETTTGKADSLIIMDPNDFYSILNSVESIVSDQEKGTIYTVSGVALGRDEENLAPGFYIRDGKKFIIR